MFQFHCFRIKHWRIQRGTLGTRGPLAVQFLSLSWSFCPKSCRIIRFRSWMRHCKVKETNCIFSRMYFWFFLQKQIQHLSALYSFKQLLKGVKLLSVFNHGVAKQRKDPGFHIRQVSNQHVCNILVTRGSDWLLATSWMCEASRMVRQTTYIHKIWIQWQLFWRPWNIPSTFN